MSSANLSDSNNWTDEQKWQFLVRHERLGELLVRQGKLSLKQLEEVLAEQEKHKRHLGEIIVEKKFLSLNEIVSTLANQKQQGQTNETVIEELKKAKD